MLSERRIGVLAYVYMWVTSVIPALGNGGRRIKMETGWKPGLEPRPFPEETS